MEDKSLSSQESLKIIHQMINSAKANFEDNGKGWLLWGSCIFLASLATFFLVHYNYHNLFLAWNIFGLFAIVMLVRGIMAGRKKKVTTYLDDLLRMVDIAFIVCLFIIIISMNVATSPNVGFGYLLMIYGFLMLVQGGALKFPPLVLGAIVNWVGSLAIFFNTVFKYDMLITAAAVLLGYIILGLILQSRHRKNTPANHGV